MDCFAAVQKPCDAIQKKLRTKGSDVEPKCINQWAANIKPKCGAGNNQNYIFNIKHFFLAHNKKYNYGSAFTFKWLKAFHGLITRNSTDNTNLHSKSSYRK